jgi:hypothetical protein
MLVGWRFSVGGLFAGTPWPGAVVTPVTPARFVCEPVVFPAALPEMWSKIADKANARG